MYDSTNIIDINTYIAKCKNKMQECELLMKHNSKDARINDYNYWLDEFFIAVECKERLNNLNTEYSNNN